MNAPLNTTPDNQKNAAFSNSHSFNISLFNNKTDNLAKQEIHSWQSLIDLLRNPDIRNQKDGRLISGTIFKENKRAKSTAIESSLLILDYDHVDKIDLSVWQNMGISFAAYTTFSHATNDKPCAYRVIIPLLNPIPADKYALLYQWAIEKSNGLIDPACKDVSRMQYLPACPKERLKDFKPFSNVGALLDWQSVINTPETLDNPITATSNVIPIQTQQAKPKKAYKQNERDFSTWVESAINTEIENVRNAANGTRNAKLNKSAFALGQIVATSWANANQSSIESRLLDAALASGLEQSEAKTTIASGLNKGLQQPREMPENSIKTQLKKESKDLNISLDLPIDSSKFVHLSKEKPLSTKANFKVLFKEYNISLKYNLITKEEEFYQNNKKAIGAESDNIAYSILTNVCRVNKISTSDVITYSTDFAWDNRYNPIINFIESKEWDGVNRFKELFETIETPNDYCNDLKGLLLSKWFLSCVAAAYNEKATFWSKGVLVFQGDQSIGKTSWFKSLLPIEFTDLIKDGVSLDLENKDSILKAISHWIVELGELDATFKKSDIAKLKAFISEKKDIVRRPYAKRESKYPRQTVFCASVNDQEFLKDSSGNVRFWVIPVTNLNAYHNIDMQQVWAQIATYYKQGVQWWLTKEEEILLEQSNKQFIEENRFTAILHEKFDWNSPKTTQLTNTQALAACGITIPSKNDINEIAKLLRSWFGEPKKDSKGTRHYLTHFIYP